MWMECLCVCMSVYPDFFFKVSQAFSVLPFSSLIAMTLTFSFWWRFQELSHSDIGVILANHSRYGACYPQVKHPDEPPLLSSQPSYQFLSLVNTIVPHYFTLLYNEAKWYILGKLFHCPGLSNGPIGLFSVLVLIIVIIGNAIGPPVPFAFPLPCVNLITQGDFVESTTYNKVYY